MDQSTSPKVFVCRNCGRMASDSGHLCSPRPHTLIQYCSYCGAVAEDARHLCAPKVMQIRYFCKNCGRAATSMNLLCSPVAIPQARAETLPPKQPHAVASHAGAKATHAPAARKKPAKKPAAKKAKPGFQEEALEAEIEIPEIGSRRSPYAWSDAGRSSATARCRRLKSASAPRAFPDQRAVAIAG